MINALRSCAGVRKAYRGNLLIGESDVLQILKPQVKVTGADTVKIADIAYFHQVLYAMMS